MTAAAAAAIRLVDSHCHLHFAPLAADIEGEMAAMAAANVDAALVVATTAAEVETVVALARRWPALFAAVGIHPLKESGEAEADAAQIARWAADPKAVAIGETGLDFSRGRGDEAEQKNRFLAHIEAAKIVAKPLVIHTRESLAETLDILRAENAGAIGGVLHCFGGDWEDARRALDLGFHISFTGIVSFKNGERMRAVAARVPADRYMVETDAPYLAPVPHRGKPCRPAWTREVAQATAAARGETIEKVARDTTRNFCELFGASLP